MSEGKLRVGTRVEAASSRAADREPPEGGDLLDWDAVIVAPPPRALGEGPRDAGPRGSGPADPRRGPVGRLRGVAAWMRRIPPGLRP